MENKKILSGYYNSITNSFHFLNEMGFTQSRPVFEKLDNLGNFVPDLPVVKFFYLSSNRKICFTIYKGYQTYCDIFNLDSGMKFSIYDYFKTLNQDLSLYFMPGETVEEKYQLFLDEIADVFKSNLKEVILGKEWVNIDFNWQDQK